VKFGGAMKRRIAVIIIALTPVLALAYYCRGIYMFLDIPPHVGDGEFQNISRREGPLVINGYRIISQPIDLSKDHEQRMILSRIPVIRPVSRLDCRLFFVIEDPEDRIECGWGHHSGINGRVALELCDSHGSAVAYVKGHFSELIWSGTLHRHALYSPPIPTPSIFHADTNETYTLTISYKGHPKLAGMKGYASIESGGRK
jgi:hypothetical protein